MKFQQSVSTTILHLFNLQDPSPEFTHGGIAQLGERLPCKQEVRGSTPLVSTMYLENCIRRLITKTKREDFLYGSCNLDSKYESTKENRNCKS